MKYLLRKILNIGPKKVYIISEWVLYNSEWDHNHNIFIASSLKSAKKYLQTRGKSIDKLEIIFDGFWRLKDNNSFMYIIRETYLDQEELF